jgi:TM2 domain-containing membrane protein YozV
MGVPNPWVAGGIGLIPGVGAMYNGQFFKGFIHVIVFALLISGASSAHGGLDVFFGLMIPAWVIYQAFEAYHVALARRDGQPIPDPLGLNEVGNWLNLGQKNPPPGAHHGAPGFAPNFAPGAVPPNPGQAPYQAPFQAGQQAGYQAQEPQGVPYTPYVDPNVPPPPPPTFWHRREPMGAIILIALGLLFLLNEVSGMVWKFAWPVFLIGLGVWLMIRRMNETKGGPQ